VKDSKLGIDDFRAIFSEIQEKVTDKLQTNPIISQRVNEVGNKIEPYVAQAIESHPHLTLIRMNVTTGYPDIKAVCQETDEIIYIECKSYSLENIDSALRSFYLSPGKALNQKITSSGMHVYFSCEMINESGNEYLPKNCSIGDLADLPVTLKQEWNSNNVELYKQERKILDLQT